MSDSIPERVRADGFELLRAVVDSHRWGAIVPEPELPGWESLIKTGNYTVPEEDDADPIAKIDPRDDDDERELLADLRAAQAAVAATADAEEPEAETPLVSQAGEDRVAGQDEQRCDLAGGAVAGRTASLCGDDHARELLDLVGIAAVPEPARGDPGQRDCAAGVGPVVAAAESLHQARAVLSRAGAGWRRVSCSAVRADGRFKLPLASCGRWQWRSGRKRGRRRRCRFGRPRQGWRSRRGADERLRRRG